MKCGATLEESAKFCSSCGTKTEQHPVTPAEQAPPQISTPPPTMQSSASQTLWLQDHYRIRKKVVTVGNKYWIEDSNKNVLGFCKQKILKLKEDIRIYSDESMNDELFCIKQKQIMDVWGTFAVIDSHTNQKIGYIKRGFLSEFGRDAWEVQNANQQVIGRIFEQSLGRALTRKYVPGGGLVPEKMTLELDGKPVAEINQQFKIIGDIWDMNCLQVPQDFDRRVLLSCMLLMGTIERSRK
jgi:uncharacterized protein YxjI